MEALARSVVGCSPPALKGQDHSLYVLCTLIGLSYSINVIVPAQHCVSDSLSIEFLRSTASQSTPWSTLVFADNRCRPCSLSRRPIQHAKSIYAGTWDAASARTARRNKLVSEQDATVL